MAAVIPAGYVALSLVGLTARPLPPGYERLHEVEVKGKGLMTVYRLTGRGRAR